MKTCGGCRAPMPGAYRSRKFCSIPCRSRFYKTSVGDSSRVALVCRECGTGYAVPVYRAKTSHFCSFVCNGAAQGRKSGDGQRYRGQGKTYVKLRQRHMHRVLAEQKIGRPLLPGEVVHHVDGNKRNNALENLQVLKSQSAHARIHGFGGRPA